MRHQLVPALPGKGFWAGSGSWAPCKEDWCVITQAEGLPGEGALGALTLEQVITHQNGAKA